MSLEIDIRRVTEVLLTNGIWYGVHKQSLTVETMELQANGLPLTDGHMGGPVVRWQDGKYNAYVCSLLNIVAWRYDLREEPPPPPKEADADDLP